MARIYDSYTNSVRKTPDANSNNNISFICMTIWRYSIASFNIKLHTNDYNTMITMVNQVSSVWFDNKLLRKSFVMNNETNLNKSEFREKFCEFINLINNSVEDSWLESTKLCWIWLQNFSLGIEYFEQCKRKWNSSSLIPELQTGQNLSLWGVWSYVFPHTCIVLWNIGQIGCRENKIFQKGTRI